MADYLEKLKEEYPGMFGPVGPAIASHEFAPRKISASLHSTGEDPHADYDVETEAWKETIRDDPSGIGVMPSPLDSDWKKFRDGKIDPIIFTTPTIGVDSKTGELELDPVRDILKESLEVMPIGMGVSMPPGVVWEDGEPVITSESAHAALRGHFKEEGYGIDEYPLYLEHTATYHRGVEKAKDAIKDWHEASRLAAVPTLDERLDVPITKSGWTPEDYRYYDAALVPAKERADRGSRHAAYEAVERDEAYRDVLGKWGMSGGEFYEGSAGKSGDPDALTRAARIALDEPVISLTPKGMEAVIGLAPGDAGYRTPKEEVFAERFSESPSRTLTDAYYGGYPGIMDVPPSYTTISPEIRFGEDMYGKTPPTKHWGTTTDEFMFGADEVMVPGIPISRIEEDMASGMFTEVAGKGPIPGKLYDARDFITEFGPLTASTHGEEPWRGLTTADFATDATFRPSGLAKYGLGAGSLGAGLMTTATPISPSSYIEGEIDSPRIPAAHHGPVFPEVIETPIAATGAPISSVDDEVDDFSSMIPAPAPVAPPAPATVSVPASLVAAVLAPTPHLDSRTIGRMSGRELADYEALIDAFERGGDVGPGESALSAEYGGLGYGGGSSGDMWT